MRATLSDPIRIDDLQSERVRRLHSLYLEGQIPTPAEHEVHPNLPRGSRENYLYFTLSSCLNFRRSSVGLWRSAFETYADPECRYLFSPEDVVERRFNDVQQDMAKHGLALQVNRHPKIWIDISRTLWTHYQGDPRNVLSECAFDVARIIQLLQHEKKELFPYLKGRKLSNYWLFILSRFTDAPLENLERLSIIPDTNVINSTIHLGLAHEKVTPAEVERIWFDLAKMEGIPPIELHPVLWNWARNGFEPAV